MCRTASTACFSRSHRRFVWSLAGSFIRTVRVVVLGKDLHFRIAILLIYESLCIGIAQEYHADFFRNKTWWGTQKAIRILYRRMHLIPTDFEWDLAILCSNPKTISLPWGTFVVIFHATDCNSICLKYITHYMFDAQEHQHDVHVQIMTNRNALVGNVNEKGKGFTLRHFRSNFPCHKL